MRSLKLTVILLCLNGIVFSAIYYFEHKTREVSTYNGILNSGIKEVTFLKVSSKGTSYTLQASGDGAWEMASPVQWPANPFAVQKILSQLQFLTKSISFPVKELKEKEHALSDYGLDRPVISVQFGDKTTTKVIHLGQSTQVGGHFYALDPAKENILVVDQLFVDALSQGVGDFMERHVFQIPPFEVKSLNIKAVDNVVLSLGKKESGWHMEVPIQVRVNEDMLNTLLGQITNTSVERFVDEKEIDLVKFGLMIPQIKLQVKGNKRDEILWIGSPVSDGVKEPTECFAKLETRPSVFVIKNGLVEHLKDGQSLLREKKLLFFDKTHILGIEIVRDHKKITLQKLETGKWQVLYPENGKMEFLHADDRVINRLFTTLEDFRAEQFVNDAPSAADVHKFGLDKPSCVIRLFNHDEKSLSLAEGSDGGLYARVQEEPFVYKVSKAFLDQFPLQPFYYSERVVWDLPQESVVESIALQDLKDGKQLWNFSTSNPKETTDNHESSQDTAFKTHLLQTIKHLDVAEVLGVFHENGYLYEQKQLHWRYLLKVTYLVENAVGQEEHREEALYLTEHFGGDLQIGGVRGKRLVFKLSKDWIANFIKLLESTGKPLSTNN